MNKRHDYPRLAITVPQAILRPRNTDELRAAIRSKKLPLVVTGAHNSHGNHLIYDKPHAALDATGMDRIDGLADDILTAGAGCTWEAIQDYLLPYGRSPVAQQSSYAFTIGGSIAGNIHGRDIRASTVEHSIEWMEVVLADGKLVRLSRSDDAELFWAMFGSQSLLGVITRVGLRTTTNHALQARSLTVPSNKLNAWFEDNKASIDFFIGRPNVADKLDQTLVTVWKAGEKVSSVRLGREKNHRRDRFIFWASTKSRRLMHIRWQLERITAPRSSVSRSNAMRPPVVPLKMFMTQSRRYSYAVQEVFVPAARLFEALKAIEELHVAQDALKLAGVTVRHISRQQAPMGYAGSAEQWAIMQYWRVPRTPQGLMRYSQLQSKLGAIAKATGGKLYLSYAAALPAREILEQYPYLHEILRLKRQLDPEERFVSSFYERLSQAVE